MKKQHKIVIGGYYGYGSIGDDTVLLSILSGIAKRLPESCVTVLGKDKSALPRIPGIKTAFKSRTNPFSLISAMASADLFISGGGSLLQDATSKRSLSYYCGLLRLAKLCGCKIFIYANGIGPLKDERKCRSALLLADLISVRDADSLELCKRLVADKATPVLSADPVFAHSFSKRRLLPLSDINKLKKPYFAVSLRRMRGSGKVDLEKLTSVFLQIKSEGFLPVFVPMQDSFDLEISKEMARATEGAVVCIKSSDELYCLLEKASFAVGMRLHFLLTSAIAGTPAVALSYDPKVEGCIRALGLDTAVSAFDFTCAELEQKIKKARASFSKSDTEAACRRLKSLAEGDFDFVVSLLKANEAATEKFYADT